MHSIAHGYVAAISLIIVIKIIIAFIEAQLHITIIRKIMQYMRRGMEVNWLIVW